MKFGRNWGRLGMKSEWTIKKISEIAEINPRESIKKGIVAKKIPMDVLQPFTRDVPSFQYEVFKGGTKFRNKDTIMARITPCLENGKIAQIGCLDPGEVGFGSTEYIVFRAREGTDPDFLYYLIRSPLVREPSIKSMVGSSGRQRVQTNVVADLQIAVPGIVEQKCIGDLLKVLDDKIQLNTKINKNLEAQAMALINDYCASAIEKIALGKLMSFDNGYAFQSKTYLSSGKYRIITIKNVLDGKIDSQGAANINEIPTRMKSNCFLSKGDVLLSLTGNVGRVGIVYEDNLLLNQRVAKICPFNNALLPWLYYYFRLPSTKVSLETIAKGTAQQNLSPVETLKLQIPFEMASANNLSQVLLTMFNMEISNFIESQQLSKLRDVLLPKLMSGELDVSGIDL